MTTERQAAHVLFLSALLCASLSSCSARSIGSPEPGASPGIDAFDPSKRPDDSLQPTAQERAGIPLNPWSELARDILAAHCGKCHRGDLATAVPKALAVFNLVEEPWYARLRADQFDKLLQRIRGIKDISPVDELAMISFVKCARDHLCEADGNEK